MYNCGDTEVPDLRHSEESPGWSIELLY